jgi:hypothetical protein
MSIPKKIISYESPTIEVIDFIMENCIATSSGADNMPGKDFYEESGWDF